MEHTNSLFEDSDILNSPYECFLYDARKNPFPIQPHYHFFMELMYVIEGVAMITCEGQTYRVHPGELIVIPPSSVHAIYATDPAAELRYFVFKLDVNQLAGSIHSSEAGNINLYAIFSGGIRKNHPPLLFHFDSASSAGEDHVEPANDEGKILYDESNMLYPVWSEDIERVFSSCVREMTQKQYGYQSIIRSRMCEVLILLIRIWRSSGFDTDTATSMLSHEKDIYTITEYIDSHLQEDLHVEDLAHLCHMSYSHFAKLFRSLYGQSCKQYISFLRLCKAENMLLFTNFDLSYISQETGFSDCSHLIHVFKGRYGMTPHQYRIEKRGTLMRKDTQQPGTTAESE